nr:hypothetical protein BDOA9_0136400 [Bradyrhizobium sp. DOA9]
MRTNGAARLRLVCKFPALSTVSGNTAAKWRAVRTAKPCGPGRRCYGQAVCGDVREPNRADGIIQIRGAREARRKVRLPGERGISRPTIAQGRPSDRHHLYAAVRFSCVCICAADRGCHVGTRPSLRPLGLESGEAKQSSGEISRENAQPRRQQTNEFPN